MSAIGRYYVYLLTNWNNKVMYAGVTNNLERRIYEHKNKLITKACLERRDRFLAALEMTSGEGVEMTSGEGVEMTSSEGVEMTIGKGSK